MRAKLFLAVAAISVVVAGCAGPEQKLGRGFGNITSLIHLGELNRSMEQTALFDDHTIMPTTGFIRGLNKTLARAGVGVYEVVTFPIPNFKNKDYGPIWKPQHSQFPDSYKPGILADSMTSTDSALGFGYGDILPIIPGSRFRIFEP